jgi:hypothetical protein
LETLTKPTSALANISCTCQTRVALEIGFERWCHKLTCAKCPKVFSSLGYNICIKLQVEVATKNLLGLEQKDSVLEFRNMEVPFNDLNTVKKFPERCKKARENKMISKES